MGLCCGSHCCDADGDGCCPRRRRSMSCSTAAVLASATAPPTVDETGVRTLALPLHECLPWRLTVRKCINIRGRIPEKPNRWNVNLITGGLADDIALHISCRHDVGYVVRNARRGGNWGAEEICAVPAMPFTPGMEFQLTIFCTENSYKISVNGRHVATFVARSPMCDVSTLHVAGTVQLFGVSYSEGVAQYPAAPAPALPVRPGTGYFATQPTFPCCLPEPIKDGGQIRVTGRVRLLPFSFFINLLNGSQLYPEPDIILHFNARFQVSNCFNVIVVNSNAAGWGKEVHPAGFPFRAGQPFSVRIVCERSSWSIFVDDRPLLKFPHRLSKGMVNALDVHGDVVVESVLFEPDSDLIKI